MVPELRDSEKLKNLGVRLGTSLKSIEILKQAREFKPLVSPQIRDLSQQNNLIERLSKNAREVESCKMRLATCKHEAIAIKARNEALIEKLGGICPTCQQTIGGHSHA
jgi:DNA repair exonuclease SbcCD ATPase subunit